MHAVGRHAAVFYLTVLPLAATLMLAGCGGGDSAASPTKQAGQSIAVGEPNPSAPQPVVAEFIAAAQQASCADVRNRLYLIDKKYVFADKAGNCADASYARALYGASVQTPLCSQADSIAGPRSSCTDDAAKLLFDVIVSHREAADLGLGATHTVTPIPFASKDPGSLQSSVTVTEIDRSRSSKVEVGQNVVVKDQQAWLKLWTAHAGAAATLPVVDFSTSMVLAVFMGAQSDGCYGTAITDVYAQDGVLKVSRVDSVPGPSSTMACTMHITYPADIVVVPRSELPVEFVVRVVALK